MPKTCGSLAEAFSWQGGLLLLVTPRGFIWGLIPAFQPKVFEDEQDHSNDKPQANVGESQRYGDGDVHWGF